MLVANGRIAVVFSINFSKVWRGGIARKMVMGKVLGLTLIETLLALAVGALVLVGGLIFYISATRNSSVNQTVSDMNAIVTAYRAYALGNAVTTDTTIVTLQNNKLLPNPLISPWGSLYTATVGVATGTTRTTVTIGITNIRGSVGSSGSDCTAILQAAGPTATQNLGAGFDRQSGCYIQYIL